MGSILKNISTRALYISSTLMLVASAWFLLPVSPADAAGDPYSWNQVSNFSRGTWRASAISDDGVKIVAVTSTYIYKSIDSGATWERTSAPSGNWMRIASSGDGNKLVAVQNGGGIYTSADSGVTWARTNAPTGPWISVDSSNNGNKLVAVQNGGGIYTSADSGVTWARTNAPTGPWSATASSSDGNKLVAVRNTGGIYTSADSGVTWIQTSAPSTTWVRVNSSSDGSRLMALGSGTVGIYISTDSGVTWTKTSAPAATYAGGAISGNGMRLLAVASGTNGAIYVSGDGGVTWGAAQASLSGGYTATSMSTDGTKMLALPASAQGVYLSTNSGTTWTPLYATNTNWRTLASSADGMQILAAQGGYVSPATTAQTGSIFRSTDGGATWKQTSAPEQSWYSVASSADGTRLAAVVNNTTTSTNGIYTSTDSGSTWQKTSAPAYSWFSIASSSDGMRLAATCYSTGANRVITSIDGGVTWSTTSAAPAGGGFSIASSGDGMTLLVSPYSKASLVLSKDGGATWASQMAAGSRTWNNVAVSSDGGVLAGASSGGILLSKDSGTTWNVVLAGDFGGANGGDISMSTDGKTLFASSTTGGYTSRDGGTTWQQTNTSIDMTAMRSGIVTPDGNRIIVAKPMSIVIGTLKAAPLPPPIDTVTVVSDAISGTAIAGDTVTVTFPDGSSQTTTVKGDGTWSLSVPSNVTLTAGQKITATTTSADSGLTSTASSTTVFGYPMPPVFKMVVAGDRTIDGIAQTPGDTVTVTLPDSAQLTAIVKDDGTWSVTLPLSENLFAKQLITATVTSPVSGLTSTLSTTTVIGYPAPPIIDQTIAGATIVTGIARTPGDVVNFTFPDGTQAKATVQSDGTWSIPVPTGITLSVDQTLTATITSTKDGLVSVETTTQVVDYPAPSIIDVITSGDTTISGTAQTPGDTVTITFPDGLTTSVTVSDDGSWSVSIPTNMTLQTDQTITATVTSSVTNLTSTIASSIVQPRPPQPPVEDQNPIETIIDLASTGSPLIIPALVALGLAGAGGMALSRRKKL